jgi:hypothetical protein
MVIDIVRRLNETYESHSTEKQNEAIWISHRHFIYYHTKRRHKGHRNQSTICTCGVSVCLAKDNFVKAAIHCSSRRSSTEKLVYLFSGVMLLYWRLFSRALKIWSRVEIWICFFLVTLVRRGLGLGKWRPIRIIDQ